MKIYFAGAIRGGRDDAGIYHEMIRYLKTFGQVLTEHVGDPHLTAEGGDGPDDLFIYQRDMNWLKACDLVVAEVSVPSLGVGYELGRATAMKKPVLCLYRPKSGSSLSALINGCPGIRTLEYTGIGQAKTMIKNFLKKPAP